MVRILFISKDIPGAACLAAAVTCSHAPANLEIECFCLAPPETHDPQIERILRKHELDLFQVRTCSRRDAETQRFDVVVFIGRRYGDNILSFPGLPVCIRWLHEHEEGLSEPLDRTALEDLYDILKRKALALFQDGVFESISQLRTTFGALIDNLTDGVMAHDRNRKIFVFNRAAEQITGFSAEEVIGNDCHLVFPGRFCGGDCSFCEDSGDYNSRLRYPSTFRTRDGHERDLEMSVVTIRTRRDNPLGALVLFRDMTEINSLRRKISRRKGFHGIIGKHPSMQKIFESIEELARVNVPILILGESGTGKEMVAEELHRLSARAEKPFVPVNCGALPEGTLESELFGHVRGAFTGAIRDKKGRFELANGGTLFLDEIGEIPPPLQVKLLRVLQSCSFIPVGGEKTVEVDVRLICATNKDLKKEVNRGRFREDLFYRLAVVPVHLPPLRDRRSDIPLLAKHYVSVFSGDMNIEPVELSGEVIRLLMEHSWPGNVRELRNAIQFAIIKSHGGAILPEHLPPEIAEASLPAVQEKGLPGRPAKLTPETAMEALRQSGGNKAKAARMLGISRTTLYRTIKEAS